MTTFQDGAASAERRAQIERRLADYPNLAEDSLAEVIAWFRNEASALDVAMVASNPEIAEPYRRFRADHIDRLTPKDLLRGILFAAVVGAIVLSIIWRAL